MTCHCGTEFEPRTSRQKHCGRACNNTAASRAFAARNRKPRPSYRRLCVRADCRREFTTKNVRKVYHHPRCACYIAWRFRREAKRSGWAA